MKVVQGNNQQVPCFEHEEFLLACRGDILAKGGVSTFLNVLLRMSSEDAPIADVINSLLSSLAEGSDDVTQQVRV